MSLLDATRVHRELLMGVSCSGVVDGAFAALKQLAASTPPSEDESDAMRRARLLTQTKRDWNRIDDERNRMRERWAELFLQFDAFLCPVAPCVAMPHDHNPDLDARTVTINGEQRPYWDQVSWISYASAAHLPAVSAPIGLTDERTARRPPDRRALPRGPHGDRHRAAPDRGHRRLRGAAGVSGGCQRGVKQGVGSWPCQLDQFISGKYNSAI